MAAPDTLAQPALGMSGVVQLLLPRLMPHLAIAEDEAPLMAGAALLPPIRQGGFECRLAPDRHQIDLQQCIFNRDGQPALLLDHLRHSARFSHPTWQRVHALILALASVSAPWTADVTEVWLEFDNDGRDWFPSIFIGTKAEVGIDTRRELLQTVLALLLPPEQLVRLLPGLIRCLELTAQGGFVSHIGVMLGRGHELIRVNVKGLVPNYMLAYVDALDWPGSRARLQVLHGLVVEAGCDGTLCLDVGATIAPTVAVECYYARGEGQAARWEHLTDLLVARGLCTAAKAAAYLAWPGVTLPSTAPHPWPLDLVRDSLVRAGANFSMLQHTQSHIKLSLRPSDQVEAKGYLWFTHSWG